MIDRLQGLVQALGARVAPVERRTRVVMACIGADGVTRATDGEVWLPPEPGHGRTIDVVELTAL